MRRLYDSVIERHFAENRQMLLLSGPRQVGKTTTSRSAANGRSTSGYWNWDDLSHRSEILAGPARLAQALGLDVLTSHRPLAVLDELHKFDQWKTWLKGMFDTWGPRVDILVTGSARMDAWRVGGDSLMGRYFGHRMHPLSVAELVRGDVGGDAVDPSPRRIDDDAFEQLLRFGGFPEPLLRGDTRFWRRWRRLRTQQLLREDLRDLSRIGEIGKVEVLAELIRQRAGQLVGFASLARQVRASADSVRRWLSALEALYYCFAVRPWHRNVARALRKEPKYYLWDWSQLDDAGARAENLVASALLKATHHWTDLGVGDYALHFVRDKDKREVDFLVVRDGTPWMLVEVKSGSRQLSSELARFQRATGASHALQVSLELPFVEADCFALDRPMIVPARTLLAQLV